MVYDNTVFEKTFKFWLITNCVVGYGQEYAGDLIDDFDEFLTETKAMKSNPGRVVFGKALANEGFERKRNVGLTYWTGLALKKPRKTVPKRYGKTIAKAIEEAADRAALMGRKPDVESPAERSERLAKFHAEIASETEEKLRGLENEWTSETEAMHDLREPE